MLPILLTLQYVADAKNSILDRLSGEEKGATAVEYGLLVGLVAVVIVVALAALETPLKTLVTDIGTKMDITP